MPVVLFRSYLLPLHLKQQIVIGPEFVLFCCTDRCFCCMWCEGCEMTIDKKDLPLLCKLSKLKNNTVFVCICFRTRINAITFRTVHATKIRELYNNYFCLRISNTYTF